MTLVLAGDLVAPRQFWEEHSEVIAGNRNPTAGSTAPVQLAAPEPDIARSPLPPTARSSGQVRGSALTPTIHVHPATCCGQTRTQGRPHRDQRPCPVGAQPTR